MGLLMNIPVGNIDFARSEKEMGEFNLNILTSKF
jgi:hypothetical protein